MPSLISHLSRSARNELFDELNYLNIQEYRSFCQEHAIPYAIYIETPSGQRRKTQDTDRKAIVLDRIRHYLKTGRVPPATCFRADIVRLDGLPARVRPSDRLYYGCYDKTHPGMMGLLRKLTGGRFRNGAIARILAREFWTAGQAPTFTEFARAWEKADAEGLGEHPEAAWLTDRARGTAGENWKAKRTRIARKVLATLAEIGSPQ